MKNCIFLILISSMLLTACTNESKTTEEAESIPVTEIENDDTVEKDEPVVIPIKDFDQKTLGTNELSVYETGDHIKIVDAELVTNQLLGLSIKLPEGFKFYEKESDYEKLVQSREYEQQYGFSINYNDHDRHFIVLNYQTSNEAQGKVAYLSNGSTSIAIQDLTGTQSEEQLQHSKKYVPGFRYIDDQHGKFNEVYLNEIMMAVGEGKVEVLSKGSELHPFIHKLSFLAKATNQKNHDTFYIGLLEQGDRVFNVSIRSDSLDTSIDELAEVWALLNTLTTNHSPTNIDRSPIIDAIREEYNHINTNIDSLKLIENGEGTTLFIDDYNITKPLRKVVQTFNDETYEYYYLTNKDLFFTFFVDSNGGEHRFYFHEGQLIRWIQPDQSVIDREESYGNQEFHEWESMLFLSSEQLKAF